MASPDTSSPNKEAGAMLTIGELSERLGLPTHILRYWETKFAQLRPLKRSGNRRYYRPDDVALVDRINDLLNRRGFTIKGAQNELRKAGSAPDVSSPQQNESLSSGPDLAALRAVRDRLANALAAA